MYIHIGFICIFFQETYDSEPSEIDQFLTNSNIPGMLI